MYFLLADKLLHVFCLITSRSLFWEISVSYVLCWFLSSEPEATINWNNLNCIKIKI